MIIDKFAQMFQHFSGLEEAILRNIDACKELADTTRSAYGPFGMSFLVKDIYLSAQSIQDVCSYMRHMRCWTARICMSGSAYAR